MNEINETELEKMFIEIKNENEEAFKKLYSKYNNLVYRIAFTILKNKEDSEDVAQIVFLKINNLEKEKLPVSNISSWLYTVTKNEAISFIRKKKDSIDLDNVYEIENKNNEVEDIIDSMEFNRLIRGLSVKEQEIITLKVITNLSFKEISQLLGEPEGTIKWRYYSSINTLKLLLSNVAMLLLTFVIGLITLFNKNQNTNKMSEAKEGRAEHFEINSIDQYNKNDNINDNMNLDINAETSKEINTENYTYIGIWSTAGIFLILTIIFAIILKKRKNRAQLKKSKKV